MKLKYYLFALLFISGLSLNAQNTDKDFAKSEAMKNIREEKDEFTKIVTYFSGRTPKNQNDFTDRFFIYISIPENNGEPRLFLKVSHSEDYRRLGRYNYIKKIYLLSDDKTIELPVNSDGVISGNGTQHSTFNMGFGKKPIYFDFVKRMVNAQITKARIVTPKNLLIEFDISARERMAINDVITLWEAVKN